MELLLYTEIVSPRLQYICTFVFKRVLGWEVTLLTQKEEVEKANQLYINYSNQPLPNALLWIPVCPLLAEQSIAQPTIHVFEDRGLPCFFEVEATAADLPFDFLAMSFYLLSRYEEYLPFSADQFGRFSAYQSIAYQHHFLRRPLIDLWIEQLWKIAHERCPSLRRKPLHYSFLPTYDIDHAWAFLHKGPWRTFGAYGRDLLKGRFNWIKARLHSQWQNEMDPYDCFEFLDTLHREFELRPLYFFLLGDYAAYDKNIDYRVPAFRQLIQKIARQYKVGIHPSFQSNEMPLRVQLEQQRLTDITGQTIGRSRQHFLRLHWPQTYRGLLQIGIQADYSMGYAAELGFRASTSHDFLWFDLMTNETTELRVVPFQVMDVSLKQYLNYSPEVAIEAVAELIGQCR
ncbi:MAG: polysaccharide deacetylase family protein, partial [Bacteroidota bacterium]